MMDVGNHMGTGGWVLSIFGLLIIFAVITGVVVWLFSARGDRGARVSATGESAIGILNRRLATGELTAEQHEQLCQTLSEASSSAAGPRPSPPAGSHA
jgi:uncharacterized membrane protein